MALDPFFQQGMNNWSRSIADRRKQAAGLTQLAQTGQMKDLLQQLAHKQKLAEADRTGEWDLSKTGLERGLMSTRSAPLFNTQVTPDVKNILSSQRNAAMLRDIGGIKGASDAGWRLKGGAANIGSMPDVLGRGLQMVPGPSTSVQAARATNQLKHKRKMIRLSDGTEIPSVVSDVEAISKAPSTQATINATQQHVQDVMEQLKQQGHTIKTGKSKKHGLIFIATDSGGRRTMYSREDGRVLEKE